MFFPSRKTLIASSFIFHCDYDSKYNSNTAKAYAHRKTHNEAVSVMDWLPQSTDQNITNAVWDHFDRECSKRQKYS